MSWKKALAVGYWVAGGVLGQTRGDPFGVTLIQIKHSLLSEYILQGGDV